MEKFNPVSRQQIEEEKKVEDFLNGGDRRPRRPPTRTPATRNHSLTASGRRPRNAAS